MAMVNMPRETDFRTLTLEEIAEFLVANVQDFGDQLTVDTLAPDTIVGEVRAGRAVIAAERNVVAVVLHEVDHIQKCNAVLWLLYVAPVCRGQGVGRAFVGDIRRRFERKLPMVLACNGSKRESFFGSCGFHVHERSDDERLIMIAKNPGTT